MAGKETAAKAPTLRQAGVCAPPMAALARASRADSRAVRAGSWPALRSWDRCVVAR
jgi:hypothetical protein